MNMFRKTASMKMVTAAVLATLVCSANAVYAAIPETGTTPEVKFDSDQNGIFIGTNQGIASTGWSNKNVLAIGYGHHGTMDDLGRDTTVLGNSSGGAGEGSTLVGQLTGATGSKNAVVVGSNASAGMNRTGDVAIGSYADSRGDESVSVGYFSKSRGNGSVALGARSETGDIDAGRAGYLADGKTTSAWQSTRGPVSVGSSASEITRQIIGVAAGTDDTDAVNVIQLKTVEEKALTVVAAGQAQTAQEIGRVDNRIAGVESMQVQTQRQVQQLDGRLDKVGALSAAIGGLQTLQYDAAAPTQIMAAVGHYSGKTATALGIAHFTDKNLLLHAGAAFGNGEKMYNVGATIKIGSGDKAQGKMLSGQEPEVLNRLVKENEALRKANMKHK